MSGGALSITIKSLRTIATSQPPSKRKQISEKIAIRRMTAPGITVGFRICSWRKLSGTKASSSLLRSLLIPERVRQILQQINDELLVARKRALKHAAWQRIAYQSLSHGLPTTPKRVQRPFIGSTLQPCPWLRLGGREGLRLPAWLWDRELKKSVRTDSLAEGHVDYYCISHTWGRWRERSVRIAGVEGWAVPTNSRFIVSDLPGVFQRLDWPVRYIWFDLFCIPQDGRPEQAEEIEKQAEIFRRTQGCVIWMHDVETWKLMESCVVWLGLDYMHRTIPLDGEVEDRLKAQKTQLKLQLDHADPGTLLNPFFPVSEASSISTEDAESQGKNPGSWWFSSLWTLQEAYLCPSSFLADRDGNLLGIGNDLTLTLDNLASLVYSHASDAVASEDSPGALEILKFTMKRWELSDLSSPCRMNLLIAAEARQSTGPRAQAIMAALGTTDWFVQFRKEHGRAPPEDDLVFGSLLLKFLQEAQRTTVGSFFLHCRLPPNDIRDAEAGEPLGTMLPLAYNLEQWQVTQAMNVPTTERCLSLSDEWIIEMDGTIRLEEAVILYQAGLGPRSGVDGLVSISSSGGGYE